MVFFSLLNDAVVLEAGNERKKLAAKAAPREFMFRKRRVVRRAVCAGKKGAEVHARAWGRHTRLVVLAKRGIYAKLDKVSAIFERRQVKELRYAARRVAGHALAAVEAEAVAPTACVVVKAWKKSANKALTAPVDKA